jgi:ligand-binding SRPBCC domain-containing protein
LRDSRRSGACVCGGSDGLKIYTLEARQFIAQPIDHVFEFFGRAQNLEAITPPMLRFRILTPEPIVMKAGTEIDYKLSLRGIPMRWKTVIESWDPPHEFVDRQARGPYKLWHHTHRFRAVEGGTDMEDTVRYGLPFGLLGDVVHALQVRRDVEEIFRYREARIRELVG